MIQSILNRFCNHDEEKKKNSNLLKALEVKREQLSDAQIKIDRLKRERDKYRTMYDSINETLNEIRRNKESSVEETKKEYALKFAQLKGKYDLLVMKYPEARYEKV